MYILTVSLYQRKEPGYNNCHDFDNPLNGTYKFFTDNHAKAINTLNLLKLTFLKGLSENVTLCLCDYSRSHSQKPECKYHNSEPLIYHYLKPMSIQEKRKYIQERKNAKWDTSLLNDYAFTIDVYDSNQTPGYEATHRVSDLDDGTLMKNFDEAINTKWSGVKRAPIFKYEIQEIQEIKNIENNTLLFNDQILSYNDLLLINKN